MLATTVSPAPPARGRARQSRPSRRSLAAPVRLRTSRLRHVERAPDALLDRLRDVSERARSTRRPWRGGVLLPPPLSPARRARGGRRARGMEAATPRPPRKEPVARSSGQDRLCSSVVTAPAPMLQSILLGAVSSGVNVRFADVLAAALCRPPPLPRPPRSRSFPPPCLAPSLARPGGTRGGSRRRRAAASRCCSACRARRGATHAGRRCSRRRAAARRWAWRWALGARARLRDGGRGQKEAEKGDVGKGGAGREKKGKGRRGERRGGAGKKGEGGRGEKRGDCGAGGTRFPGRPSGARAEFAFRAAHRGAR